MIVLDTNVVISALLWRGTPYRLLEVIRGQDGLQLYSSSALLEELTDVASRPAFTKRLATIGKTAPEIFVDYLEAVELVEPVDVPRVARDPGGLVHSIEVRPTAPLNRLREVFVLVDSTAWERAATLWERR